MEEIRLFFFFHHLKFSCHETSSNNKIGHIKNKNNLKVLPTVKVNQPKHETLKLIAGTELILKPF